ncbi:MAG: efflux RND transporter periplasmic adaptor subunit [Planctomycetes bacterium]|nr:efflux RND transporter periplasmic adaptor subunit [Planctomycetota bacterium]
MTKGWLIALLLVAGCVLVGLLWMSQPDAVVEVTSPRTETIRAYIEEQAVTELPHEHLISMPIAGWLEPITLREGDPVREGQVVARLEQDDLRDRVLQAEQRVAVLESRIKETEDHRLEHNALIEAQATVKAIDETVKAAEAKLDASRALRDFASGELDRIKRLVEKSAVTDRELRAAELEYRRAEAQFRSDSLELAALKTIAAVSYIGPKFITDYIDRKSFRLEQLRKELVEAKTQLEIERRNLQRAEIRSPIDGVVLQRYQTRRQFLPAGTPLLTVGRLEEMEVVAEVLTQKAPLIDVGDPVEVFGEGLEKRILPGEVTRVHPAGFKKISSLGVEQQRVKVVIRPETRPPGLGVGFRVYVRILYDEVPNALVVPRTCLFRDEEGGWNVMIVRGGVVRQQAVEVGLLNDEEAQIVSGLSEDDHVLTHPSREIVPGMHVRTVQ